MEFSLIWYLLGANLLAAVLMAYDKFCAVRGMWRVPEASLFGVSLLGGSPAVFFLMGYLRHKSNKASFRWRLNIILGIQIILLGAFGLLF